MRFLLLVFCVFLNWRYTQGVQGYTKFAYSCVGKEVNIECDPGEVIRILQAFYGQSAKGEKYCAYDPSDPCTESTLDVDLKCTGKEEACIYDTGSTTHRQCGGVANYIAVDFECMPKDQMINICSSTEVEDRTGYIVSPGFPDLMGESSVQCKCTISSLVPDLKIEISEVFATFRYAPSRDCTTWSDAIEVTDGTQSTRFCKAGSGQLISTPKSTNVTLLHKTGTGGALWLHYESPTQDGRLLVRCGAKAEEPTTITSTTTTIATTTTEALNTTVVPPTTQNETTTQSEEVSTEITTINATTLGPDVYTNTILTSTTSDDLVIANGTMASTAAPNSTTGQPEDGNTTTPIVTMVSQYGVTAAVVGAIVGCLIVVFLIIIALIVMYFKRVNSKDFA